MKFEVAINNTRRVVELERDAERWRISLDGKVVDADAVEIAPNIFSILLDGKSYEIRVAPTAAGTLTLQTGRHEFTAEVTDPRAWRGRRHGALEAEGRQQILAPMPGKIVRVLVQAGEKVEAGQGFTSEGRSAGERRRNSGVDRLTHNHPAKPFYGWNGLTGFAVFAASGSLPAASITCSAK